MRRVAAPDAELFQIALPRLQLQIMKNENGCNRVPLLASLCAGAFRAAW